MAFVWYRLGFPTGRDSTTFRDNGTEVSSLSRDKGTTGQAQNLVKGRDGLGQPAKIQDGTRDKFLHCPGAMGQRDKLKMLPRNGPGWDFDILPWDRLGRDFYNLSCPRTGPGTEGKKEYQN